MLTAVLTTNDPAIAHLAPFAIGAMYMAMIYAGSHISGAHYNPAVTLAAFIRGKIETADAIVYIFFQIMGAASAAAIGVYLHDCGGGAEIVMHANPDPIGSFLADSWALLRSLMYSSMFPLHKQPPGIRSMA
ncbi:MAG: aquaporin [Saprospiraceae bacterium]